MPLKHWLFLILFLQKFSCILEQMLLEHITLSGITHRCRCVFSNIETRLIVFYSTSNLLLHLLLLLLLLLDIWNQPNFLNA